MDLKHLQSLSGEVDLTVEKERIKDALLDRISKADADNKFENSKFP
jgi:hypothetical protein